MVSAGMELVVIEEHAMAEGLGLSTSRDRWWSVEGGTIEVWIPLRAS